MTTDAVDVAIIFGFILSSVILTAAVAVGMAFKAGWEHGKRYGIKWEKVRRKRVEEKVEREMEERWRIGGEPGWLKELDV